MNPIISSLLVHWILIHLLKECTFRLHHVHNMTLLPLKAVRKKISILRLFLINTFRLWSSAVTLLEICYFKLLRKLSVTVKKLRTDTSTIMAAECNCQESTNGCGNVFIQLFDPWGTGEGTVIFESIAIEILPYAFVLFFENHCVEYL